MGQGASRTETSALNVIVESLCNQQFTVNVPAWNSLSAKQKTEAAWQLFQVLEMRKDAQQALLSRFSQCAPPHLRLQVLRPEQIKQLPFVMRGAAQYFALFDNVSGRVTRFAVTPTPELIQMIDQKPWR